ncbi:MAG: ChuX/HutX family heme-like substrate-binding protein [Verrucomicrobiota bacterium]
MKPATIREKRSSLLETKPKLQAREVSERLGITEGELVASECGNGTVRLKEDFFNLLNEFSGLRTAMAVTRNRLAVIEVNGTYPKFQYFEGMGWGEGEIIDLRLAMGAWYEAFYVPPSEDSAGSLQFFDREGYAVHKLFTRDTEFVETSFLPNYSHPKQKASLDWKRDPVDAVNENPEIDQPAFCEAWSNLRDIHNAGRLLKRYRLTHLQGVRFLGDQWAYRTGKESLESVLLAAAERGLKLSISVVNLGTRQIRGGIIPDLKRFGKWMNLLQPEFNLHMDESQIHQVWKVKTPSTNGEVLSLDVFDKLGQIALQIQGTYSRTEKQQRSWIELLNEFEALRIEE